MIPDLATTMARLARDLHGERLAPATLHAVAERAVALIPSADWVSITVSRRKRYVTLASTHARAAAADRLQYELGEGPCVEVSRHGDWLRSGDVARDQRWPAWGPVAAKEGVGSLLSISLVARDERIGALNMYAAASGGFADRDEVDYALLFGVHAALAVSSANLVSGLETAMGSRHVIGAAQGVIMERYGLSLEQSFAMLSRISSQTNVKLTDICTQVVATGEIPGTASRRARRTGRATLDEAEDR